MYFRVPKYQYIYLKQLRQQIQTVREQIQIGRQQIRSHFVWQHLLTKKLFAWKSYLLNSEYTQDIESMF